jgi:hypothetical protein
MLQKARRARQHNLWKTFFGPSRIDMFCIGFTRAVSRWLGWVRQPEKTLVSHLKTANAA